MGTHKWVNRNDRNRLFVAVESGMPQDAEGRFFYLCRSTSVLLVFHLDGILTLEIHLEYHGNTLP